MYASSLGELILIFELALLTVAKLLGLHFMKLLLKKNIEVSTEAEFIEIIYKKIIGKLLHFVGAASQNIHTF